MPSKEDVYLMAHPEQVELPPGGDNLLGHEEQLDCIVTEFLNRTHGTLAFKGQTDVSGYPGRVVEGALPDNGRFRAHLVTVNGNFYYICVMGSPTWVNSGDARRFLDSIMFN